MDTSAAVKKYLRNKYVFEQLRAAHLEKAKKSNVIFIDPPYGGTILDPTCGGGGFLYEYLKVVTQENLPSSKLEFKRSSQESDLTLLNSYSDFVKAHFCKAKNSDLEPQAKIDRLTKPVECVPFWMFYLSEEDRDWLIQSRRNWYSNHSSSWFAHLKVTYSTLGFVLDLWRGVILHKLQNRFQPLHRPRL